MKSPVATRQPARAGFTLIELLVVIAIIAVLAALTTAAVQKVRDVGKRTQTVTEINDLDMACTKFKTDFGTNVPQRFRFPTQVPPHTGGNATQNGEMDAGYRLLKAMFRAWPPPAAAAAPGTALTIANGVQPILFRGQTMNSGTVGQVIDSSQCLVFFLGGPTGQGFTPTGPYSAGTNTSRKGPYFEFPDNRLSTDGADRTPATDGKLFQFAFVDPYGTPYAFFSTGSSEAYATGAWTGPGTSGALAPFTMNAKPVNQGKVQIISAGRNKRFGPGGAWMPGSGQYAGESTDGGDDLANFNSGLQLSASNN